MNLFNNLKVSTKLIINLIITVILVSVIGILGVANMNKINKSGNGLYYDNLAGISAIADIDKYLAQGYFDMQLMLTTPDANKVKELSGDIADLKDKTNESITKYKSAIAREEDKEMFSKFEMNIV